MVATTLHSKIYYENVSEYYNNTKISQNLSTVLSSIFNIET